MSNKDDKLRLDNRDTILEFITLFGVNNSSSLLHSFTYVWVKCTKHFEERHVEIQKVYTNVKLTFVCVS